MVQVDPEVPELVAGDRLSRAEFERRYAAARGLPKAELIEGMVYVPSPVRVRHGAPSFDLIGWLFAYRVATPGVSGGDDTTVRLEAENELQPDAHLRIDVGGQSRVDADDYIEGAPELAVEVTASTASYDMHAKKRAYQRNGVREYLVWRTDDEAIDWFALHRGRYRRLKPGPDGVLRSDVFPGLWLDPAALLSGDLATVLRVLQRGLSSPEHAAFVKRLARPRRRGAR